MSRLILILGLCFLMGSRPAWGGEDTSPFGSGFGNRTKRVGEHCLRAFGLLTVPFRRAYSLFGPPAAIGIGASVSLMGGLLLYYSGLFGDDDTDTLKDAVHAGTFRLDDFSPLEIALGLVDGPPEVVAVILKDLSQGELGDNTEKAQRILDIVIVPMTSATRHVEPYQRHGYVTLSRFLGPQSKEEHFDFVRNNVISIAHHDGARQTHRKMLIQILLNFAQTEDQAFRTGVVVSQNLLHNHDMPYLEDPIPFEQRSKPKPLLYAFVAGLYYSNDHYPPNTPDPLFVRKSPRLFDSLHKQIIDKEDFFTFVERLRR